MNPKIGTLVKKPQSLDPDQTVAAEDSVEPLRGQDRALTQYAAALSAPAFGAIWDNPEDAVYDAL